MTSRRTASAAALLAFALASTAAAQAPRPGQGPEPEPARIAWFETWRDGAAAARATGRPILLVAAAPQCHDISGLW